MTLRVLMRLARGSGRVCALASFDIGCELGCFDIRAEHRHRLVGQTRAYRGDGGPALAAVAPDRDAPIGEISDAHRSKPGGAPEFDFCVVVDDDEDILVAARLLLRQLFADVATARSPEEALPLLSARKPDVVAGASAATSSIMRER